MKLQILREGQEGIVNYEQTTVSRNEIDISHVVNNECEQILATDVLDDFNTNAMPELIHALVSKLRMENFLWAVQILDCYANPS